MRQLRILSVVVLVLAAAWLGMPRATAVTSLIASDPVPRQVLPTAPGGVSLSFDHTIAEGTAKILILNSKGEHVGVGDVEYWGSTLSMQLGDDLPDGTYTVQYRVPDAEGVPEGGAFQFAVGSGTWTDPLPDAEWHGQSAEPPGMANPDPYETGAASTEEPTQPEVVIETPTATPTPSETVQSSEPSPAPTTAAPQPAPGPDWWPWALGGAVVVLVAGLGSWLATRNRRHN